MESQSHNQAPTRNTHPQFPEAHNWYLALVPLVGRRIRALRREQSITQARLAARLRVSTAAVSEAEKCGVKGIETISRYAWALNTSPAYLAFGIEGVSK